MNIYDDYFGLGDMAQIVNNPISVESMFIGLGQNRGGDTMGQDFYQLGQSEGSAIFGRDYLGLGQSPNGDGPEYYGLGEYNSEAYSYGLGRLDGTSIENLKSRALASVLPVIQSASRTAADSGAGLIATAIVNTGRLFETRIAEATSASQINVLMSWIQGKIAGLMDQIQSRVDTTEEDSPPFVDGSEVVRRRGQGLDPTSDEVVDEGDGRNTMLWAGGLIVGVIGLYLLYKE